MIERRAMITRSWRPGAPTRHVDDFIEVPAVAAPAQEQPVRHEERRNMDARLHNWAKWCTTWGGFPRDRVATAVACQIMEEAALGPRPSPADRRAIDEDDAKAIERGLWKLPNLQRDLLRLHYVRGRAWFDVCRITGIRVSRIGFAEQMDAARAAIESVVGNNMERMG